MFFVVLWVDVVVVYVVASVVVASVVLAGVVVVVEKVVEGAVVVQMMAAHPNYLKKTAQSIDFDLRSGSCLASRIFLKFSFISFLNWASSFLRPVMTSSKSAIVVFFFRLAVTCTGMSGIPAASSGTSSSSLDSSISLEASYSSSFSITSRVSNFGRGEDA